MSTSRRVAWVLSLLLLVANGVPGLYSAVSDRYDNLTPSQWSVRAGVILYSVLGLTAAWGMFRRRPWGTRVATAWGVVVTYVAATAALAYAPNAASIGGAITSGIVAALIAAGVVWTARATSAAP
jgi:hypothetical protein